MIARVEPHAVLAQDLEVEGRLLLGGDGDGSIRRNEDEAEQHVKQQLRPDAARRITYPDPASQTNSNAVPATTGLAPLPARPRNKSPYRTPHTPTRNSHLRSRSSPSPGLAPPMARAHSSPCVPSSHGSNQFSSSPVASPRAHPIRSSGLRSLSPFQPLLEDSQMSLATSQFYDGGIQSISEDAELDITPRSSFDQISQPVPVHATLNSARPLAVRRQRPTSPLHSLSTSGYTPHSSTSRPSSGSSSPLIPSGRFNEGYPSLHHYASTSSFSSVPSTPTSTRSRSPSVSSLETIEDAPDLEWEAIEADRAAKLAAEAQGEDGESRRRGSLDMPGSRPVVGFGFGRRGDSKKRWSVCGGERRADLDLETIWED